MARERRKRVPFAIHGGEGGGGGQRENQNSISAVIAICYQRRCSQAHLLLHAPMGAGASATKRECKVFRQMGMLLQHERGRGALLPFCLLLSRVRSCNGGKGRGGAGENTMSECI